MKEYIGKTADRSVTVHIMNEGGGTHPLEHHVRHSPDGFSWGYGGSGPSELARCILLDYFGWMEEEEREAKVQSRYQDFKFSIIAALPMDEDFKLTSYEIERWLSGHAGGER